MKKIRLKTVDLPRWKPTIVIGKGMENKKRKDKQNEGLTKRPVGRAHTGVTQ